MITKIKKPIQYTIVILLIPFLYLSSLAVIDDIDKYGMRTAIEYAACCGVVVVGVLNKNANGKDFFALFLILFLIIMDVVNLTY